MQKNSSFSQVFENQQLKPSPMAGKLMNSFPVRPIACGGNNLLLLIHIGTFTHFSLPTCLIYLYLDFYKVVTELCAPVNALTQCNFMEIYAPAMLNILSSHKSLAFWCMFFPKTLWGTFSTWNTRWAEIKINVFNY